MNLSSAETIALLSRFPAFADMHQSLPYGPRMPAHMVRETKDVLALARRFNDEVARPAAVALDRKTHEDPDTMPWDFVETANRWGLYTHWVPRIFGGKGYNLPSMSCFSEEIASVCVGIANVIGVHYLGVAGLTTSGNPGLANRVLREVAQGEKTGKPCLVALAVTEPSAGTLRYARERFQGGRAIIGWTEIAMILADMSMKTDAASLCLDQACRMLEEGGSNAPRRCLAAALHIHEMACGVVNDGIQVLGGYGYMKDYGQEKRYRDARQVQALLGPASMKKLSLLGKEAS